MGNFEHDPDKDTGERMVLHNIDVFFFFPGLCYYSGNVFKSPVVERKLIKLKNMNNWHYETEPK